MYRPILTIGFADQQVAFNVGRGGWGGGLGVQVTGPELEAIEARLKAADEVHPPVVRWELRCAHGLSIATTTKSPPVDWSVNGGRAQCCSECDDDEAEDVPAAPSVHSWTSQAYTEEKMSKEDVRALVAEVRRLQAALAEARGEPAEPVDAVTAFRELAAACAPVVLTNCRTCAHDFRDQEGKARCWIVEEGDPVVYDWIADDANVTEDGEPTPTATGCPGWRARV